MPRKTDATFDARAAFEILLRRAIDRGASDIHLDPEAEGYAVRWRIDGLLENVDALDTVAGEALVNRLMVAAELLTYRRDVPQEGRATEKLNAAIESLSRIDLRISVMPTTHGLRAVVRLPAELLQPRVLESLDLSPATLGGLKNFCRADMGMLLLCGPAGSGKTTTIYALLEYLRANNPGLSVVSVEDPVERDLPGVTQIQTAPFGELTYEKILRSVLRQDPQVLALGEIRDAQTACIAVGAALSGHRLISTLHAATPETALIRLREMRIERYQITGSLFGIVTMRLLRRSDGQGGYRGRIPVAQFARLDEAVRQAVLAGADASRIRRAIEQQASFESLATVANRLVHNGLTDQAEVDRVLGAL